MAEYTQKKISELEASLTGKKIEVVGVPSIYLDIDESNPHDPVFDTYIYDQNNLYCRIRGSAGHWWPNKIEKILNKARYDHLPLLVSGTYRWSFFQQYKDLVIAVEKMGFFKTTGDLSLVDEEGNISLTDEGNLSFIKRWFQK